MADGKIPIQSDLVPDNYNPKQPVTDVRFVTGASQAFASIEELVAFHPNKLKIGQAVRVVSIDEFNDRVTVTEYTLVVDPATLLDANKDSIVTIDTFLKYWSLSNQTQTESDKVFAYSPDGAGGTIPPFPYIDNPDFEANWHAIALPADRWVRFRDSDEFQMVGLVKIFTGWTPPISRGVRDINGDYIDDLYLRQDVDTTERTGLSGLVNNKSYLILEGTVEETTPGLVVITYVDGRAFQYKAANSYVFTSCRMVETVATPPRTVDGKPNNSPVGWSDVPPDGEEQLWNIQGPKSVYGDLKGDWQLRKIFENPDLIRFGEFASPSPNSLVGTNDTAATGSPGDDLLNENGWKAAFEEKFKYIAERQTTGSSPAYTQWTIKKITGESGEYVSRVFKLFDLNADFDFVSTQKPVTSDPIGEGFFDSPQAETATQINYVFEGTFFFDGTLKGSWSNGVPYTGREVFNDLIESSLGDSFKYDPNSDTPSVAVPASLTLTAQLYKGLRKISEVSEVTYQWKRVYNNGAAEDLLINSFTNTDPVYLLAGTGTPGTDGYLRDGQRLVVKPAGVTGKAVFQVTQTFIIPDGEDIVFVEQFAINDVTDGIDAKDLSIKADAQLVIFDGGGPAFAPEKVNLNAFYSNLVDPVIKWFQFVDGVWELIDPGDSSIAPAFIITTTTFGSRLQIDVAEVFDADDDLQELRFAASTHATNPDLANSQTTFSDYTTITKAAAAAVGTPGADATVGILDNEYQNITLDDDTFIPMANEIGATGRAQTIVSVFKGATQIPYGGGAGKFTISLTSDNVDVAFASNTVGLTNEVRVYVNTWAAGQRKAVCTIEITYDTGSGNIVFQKKFTVGSTLDTPGALAVIIESNKGFAFLVGDRTSKTLTAKVYDSSKVPTLQAASGYYFNWTIGGVTDVAYVQGGGGTNGEVKSLSRSQVLLNADVIVRISKVASPTSDDIIRSATIRVEDIADGRLYRLFSAAPSAPVKPISSVGPAGNATWVPFVEDARWAVDGYENAGSSPLTYTWSDVYQVGGEAGDQGFAGGFPMKLYRSSGSDPNTAPSFGAGGNASTIAQMVAAGWRSSNPGQMPTSGYIWETQRLYKTENVSGNELAFDSNGYPVSEVVFSVNAVWIAPQRLTPAVPSSGGQGDPGWSPVFAVIVRSSTSKVLQLVGWTGGSGSQPGGIGLYVSAAGLTGNINAAENLMGGAGQPGSDGLGEEVYASEGACSIFGVTLSFGLFAAGKYLAMIQLSAEDNGGSGPYHCSRRYRFSKNGGSLYNDQNIDVISDGFSLARPPVSNMKWAVFNATEGLDRLDITSAVENQPVGYQNPRYKVSIFKLKS